jgi:6-pyruvoyltetrahydropterin/6-carboxytetrahydropterin synthase
MYRISKSISFCYGHRLLNYDGKCKHLHGHNARAVIILEQEELDERGMLVDFKDIKDVVKKWVDTELDHNMLLCKNDPILPVLREAGERFFVMDDNPTAENIAKLIYEFVAAADYPVIDVSIWETDTCYASYRDAK